MTDTLAAAPSRRETNKRRTRQLLRETALQLFASQGYDSTTAEDIAEKAGVSSRTFFRYFATKESALFIGRNNWMQSLATTFLEQPAALSDVDALREALVLIAPRIVSSRKALRLYERAVASSAALRGREADYRQDDVAILSEAIATRRGLPHADETCSLLAAVSFLTHRRALDVWLAGPARADLAVAINDEFDRLVRLFA